MDFLKIFKYNLLAGLFQLKIQVALWWFFSFRFPGGGEAGLWFWTPIFMLIAFCFIALTLISLVSLYFERSHKNQKAAELIIALLLFVGVFYLSGCIAGSAWEEKEYFFPVAGLVNGILYIAIKLFLEKLNSINANQ